MDGYTLIEQQCILIKGSNPPLTGEQLTATLDILVVELNKDKTFNNSIILQQIVNTILIRNAYDQIFSKASLYSHPLFSIIRDCYLSLLIRWRNVEKLDKYSGKVFLKIANLFVTICFNTTDANVDSLKQLIIHEPLITELRICLEEIASDGKHLKDKQIKAIDYGIRAIHYLEKGRVDIQSVPMLTELLEATVKCVCSRYFIKMFKRIAELEELNEAQTFLLDTCTDVITWYDAGFYNRTHIAVRTALLHTFVRWFQKYVSSFERFSKLAIKIIGQLCITLIGGNAADDDVFPKEIRHDYSILIDQLFSIFNSIVEMKSMNDLILSLTRVLTQNLYSLTMTSDLRSYMKNKHMIPLLINLTNIQDDDIIQFHVYRILAVILTEEDIKTLANPSKIANVFLRFFNRLIDDSSMLPRFHNLLRSLKSLIQHDQIKEELTKQNALPLLIRCSTELKFDPIKARLAALEIILALTFNDDAAHQLKQNAIFLDNLKILATSSTEKRLERVAEGILWKLEKEGTANFKSSVSKTADNIEKTYHIMLSYSHGDKELCYRIYDRLVQEHYRVWLDRDQIHGGAMAAMADAIENSEFVFICMSDTYKQSAYCQSEAHYAFERRCNLIPLIMKLNYRPDGWLGILVSGKVYIDFARFEFELAYEKLKQEMVRQRGSPSQTPTNSKLPQQKAFTIQALINATVDANNREAKPIFRKYPNSIIQWTNDDVRFFLTNENFNSLFPILGNMNGRLLHETYKKCKTYWDFMFQTFKSEIDVGGQQKVLTVETYIRFLDEIEKYVPIVPDNKTKSSSKTSSICVII